MMIDGRSATTSHEISVRDGTHEAEEPEMMSLQYVVINRCQNSELCTRQRLSV